MDRRSIPFAASISAAVVVGMLALCAPASAACDAGTKIDGSTVATATKSIETAGFRNIRGLKKGCDSFWHATASKDGVVKNVSVSPQGVVAVEGN